MNKRFEARKKQVLQDAQIKRAVWEDMSKRLRTFTQPFAACLRREDQQNNARVYWQGLLSDLERKNVESIAYLHDRKRNDLQYFIGEATWGQGPLLDELARQVGRELGEADGVIIFDPSSFEKDGKDSVGVQRQWLGRLGKVENGQVGVYLGYASRKGQALCDVRLYLPEEWARDNERRHKCGVPREVRFHTRQELALEMLDQRGAVLPHAWVTGDDELGRDSKFRAALRARSEHYVLAVPSNTLIRDLEKEPPPWRGRGPQPKVRFERVDTWLAGVGAAQWTEVDVRDGEQGPLQARMLKHRVQTRQGGSWKGPEELLVIMQVPEKEGGWKTDYYLSNADGTTTTLDELARAAKAEHRIEETFKCAKSEAGLADYEVRTWRGWHHHQALALIAAWFLSCEVRRGKKVDPGADRADGARTAGGIAA